MPVRLRLSARHRADNGNKHDAKQSRFGRHTRFRI
jgi:hypothetical protein